MLKAREAAPVFPVESLTESVIVREPFDPVVVDQGNATGPLLVVVVPPTIVVPSLRV